MLPGAFGDLLRWAPVYNCICTFRQRKGRYYVTVLSAYARDYGRDRRAIFDELIREYLPHARQTKGSTYYRATYNIGTVFDMIELLAND
jgi:hypothetical protein